MGQPRAFSLRSRVAGCLLAALATLTILEIGSRVVFYQRNSEHVSAVAYYGQQLWRKVKLNTSTRALTFDRPLYRADAELGYSCHPGRHEMAIELRSWAGTDVWKFTAMLDQQGYRQTSPEPSAAESKPRIWIHGCSFTWGYALNNADTFPFMIQSELPAYTVKNFAGNGYATVHALLQLRKMLPVEKPEVVIIVYNNIHLRRNLAAQSFLRNFQTVGILDQIQQFKYPRVKLLDRKLEIELIPIVDELAHGSEPSEEEMFAAACALMDEIQKLCESHQTPLLLAVQTDASHDGVVDYCDEQGWMIVDMALPSPLPGELTLQPFDTHPNRAAHEQYAAKLLKRLKPFLARHSKP